MNKKLVLTLTMMVLTAALLLSVPAAADSINLVLAAPVQTVLVGSTVSFTATVTAPTTNGATIFLNGDSFNVDAPLILDDFPFVFGFPLSMSPGDSFTGLLFIVDAPTGPRGSYFGNFQILGGSDGSALDPISNVTPFQVDVVAEPGSMLLLGTGSMALFGALRRKLRG